MTVLEPLHRKPDKSTARSERRERAAIALERLAARVRADEDVLRFEEGTVSRDFQHSEHGPYLVGETTTITLQWKKP
jgi:hypothetical protein